jgi:hypothetical protein
VYELFSEAMSDGQHDRYEESLRKLVEAEKVDPNSMPVRYLMALDYYRMKDFRRAMERFQSKPWGNSISISSEMMRQFAPSSALSNSRQVSPKPTTTWVARIKR